MGIVQSKKGWLHNQTKIRRKEGRFLTSPKKGMYITHGWEEKNKYM
jgi:hypothetical protein